MDRTALHIVLTLSLLLCPWTAAIGQKSQCVPDSVSFVVSFRQSKWNLDISFGDNTAVLDSIRLFLSSLRNDSSYRFRRVGFTGSASPEGSVRFNRFLSERRALSLFGYLSANGYIDDDEKTFLFLGRDWEGVLRLAETDAAVPYREETIALFRSIADEKRRTGREPARSLERLKRLRGGVPYRYLYRKIFPPVRASRLVIGYDRIFQPIEIAPPNREEAVFSVNDSIPATLAGPAVMSPGRPPFYMDVRSNLLFDALALPNIGMELYLGRDFSLGGNWMYAWWSRNARHRYWRAYGGELFGRWWFGRAARRKPLTGHHIGVYGQIYTYDFERGGEGEMGGKPGGNLWEKAQWGAGVEYGYSLPVGRRLNIDFSVGLGYTTGYYHTYRPVGTHYVWQSTNHRKWFGPTKAEISLVWLIGRGNCNYRTWKGGAL